MNRLVLKHYRMYMSKGGHNSAKEALQHRVHNTYDVVMQQLSHKSVNHF